MNEGQHGTAEVIMLVVTAEVKPDREDEFIELARELIETVQRAWSPALCPYEKSGRGAHLHMGGTLP